MILLCMGLESCHNSNLNKIVSKACKSVFENSGHLVKNIYKLLFFTRFCNIEKRDYSLKKRHSHYAYNYHATVLTY